MTNTYSHAALTSRPFGLAELKANLIEPFLVVGVSLFWIVTLPFAAAALFGVKIWDAVSVFSRSTSRNHPLILRRGAVGKSEIAPAHVASAKRA